MNKDANASPTATSARHISRHKPRHHATVAKGFVDGMLSGLYRLQRDPTPLLAASGVSFAESASRIPVTRYAVLYNRIIAELGDEAFGLFPQPMPIGSFEFLCRGMLGAQTLDEALARASRFLRIVLPDLALSVRRTGNRAELEIAETSARFDSLADPARVFAFEWLLRLIHGVACWFVGRGIALDSVRFPYPRPLHADDYALVYTEHSSFEGNTLLARFRDNLLELPIRRDDDALGLFLKDAPGRISMLYRRDREMVLRVRDLLRAALPTNLSIDDVARHIHLSTRTLHRRLEEEGSSFRRIKEATRRDIAYARLTKTAQPIAELAADLGYADTSTFYRAFVAWSGMSPEQFRAQLAARHDGSGTRAAPMDGRQLLAEP